MDELDTFLSSTPKPVNLVAELKQATKNEVFSPDILPFQKELVTNLLENVEQQQEVLDEIVKQHTHRQAVVNFQIELERTKYLIQHYLRVRIKKIQGSPSEKQKKIVPHKEFFNDYHQYYTKNTELHHIFAESELELLKKYNQLVTNHFDQTFLQFLPGDGSDLKSLTEPSMIKEPPTETFVFVKVLEEIGTYQLLRAEEDFTLGSILLVPYKPIKILLIQGKLALI